MAKRAAELLDPAYDLDTGDEIVDEVTVATIVRGQRRVASTLAERTAATLKMIRLGYGVREIANHIGCSIPDAYTVIETAGYKVIPDPMFRKSDGRDGNRMMIARVN